MFRNIPINRPVNNLKPGSDALKNINKFSTTQLVGNTNELEGNDEIKAESPVVVVSRSEQEITSPEIMLNNINLHELKVYKHIQTYSAATLFLKIVRHLPTHCVVKETLVKIVNFKPLDYYIKIADENFDLLLSRLDGLILKIKESKIKNVKIIFLDNSIFSTTSRARVMMKEALGSLQRISTDFLKNSAYHLTSIPGRFILFMGDQPIIRSRLNPIFKKVNLRIIHYLNLYLPPGSQSYADNTDSNCSVKFQSNELVNTFRLVDLAISRLRPILYDRLEQIVQSPNQMNKYFSSVYREARRHRGDGKIIVLIATLETIRTVANDGYELLEASWFLQLSWECQKKNSFK